MKTNEEIEKIIEECDHIGYYSAISTNLVMSPGDKTVKLVHSVLCGNCGTIATPTSSLKLNMIEVPVSGLNGIKKK